ncbi:MAG: polysaccharide deacetylase family protein [Candidatus Eremiobacteraeota bacterium]|nr:polysaccharide deacetylase family protein [Candidatus Eremiobacteraeota bacterium]
MQLLLALLLNLPAVLMYHQVDSHTPPDKIGRALTISPAQLSDELDYLESRHLRGVSVDDYLQANAAHHDTGDMVILTFDDGYADQYTDALPILLAHHAHATFFITTGNVGRRNHLTWNQIIRLQHDGMSIGGHSVQHVDLASLSPARQQFQIDGCLTALRDHGIDADTYAYPGGTFNRATEAILTKEPVALAFTTDPSHRLGMRPQFEIARLRVKDVTTMAAFQRFFTKLK